MAGRRYQLHGHESPAMVALGDVAVISPEYWDDVWRRNQHLASRLPSLGLARHVTFVNPPGRSKTPEFSPVAGLTVVSPRRIIPKRLGGLRAVASELQQSVIQQSDTLWINDPTVGAWLAGHRRVVYDVTDDWRSAALTPGERRRLIGAENILAQRSRTVVCSEELHRRWKARYGLDALIVRNAGDVAAIHAAQPRSLGAEGPHVGYVGTLHDERLDVALVIATADALAVGQVHLVGPDSLSPGTRARLASHPRVTLHGGVPASEVPSWLVSFDVLISPHLMTGFTLSLDAIKAYEYLATTAAVVATPTSGFQDHSAPGLNVTAVNFADAVSHAAKQRESFCRDVPDWDDRTREFAAALVGARKA